MFRKILTTIAAVVCAAGLSIASQIPIVSGPQDPSQMLATINSLIQSINSGVNGKLSTLLTPAGNLSTAETNMAAYSLPANQLGNLGDGVRVVCWGRTATNSNTKSAKLYFGSTAISTNDGTGIPAPSNKTWYLELLVMRSGAATQVVMGRGQVDVSPVSIYTTAGAEALTAAVTIKCTGQSGTAAQDITAAGFIVEQIK